MGVSQLELVNNQLPCFVVNVFGVILVRMKGSVLLVFRISHLMIAFCRFQFLTLLALNGFSRTLLFGSGE